MTIFQRIRPMLAPLVGSGIAVSLSGATAMFTAVKNAIPAYFHLGVTLVVVGCLMSAYGGYMVGRDAGKN